MKKKSPSISNLVLEGGMEAYRGGGGSRPSGTIATHQITPMPTAARIKLLKSRIRQIEYDRKQGGKVDGEYPRNSELITLRAKVKKLEK